MSKERFSIPASSHKIQGAKGSKGLGKGLLIFALFLIGSPGLLLSQIDPASEWHLLYLKIRDRLIAKEEAQRRLRELEILIKKTYSVNLKKDIGDRLCFPLKGYSPTSIGGKQGSGYKVEGYDFFDGNQHKGHPGHDLFVRDRNQDGLDDETGKPVDVLSASSGIVVSVNLDWRPPSPIRGGNYIWIYEPPRGRYYYYAHLNDVFVKVGQIVFKGDSLGTVGRTGLNAYQKKSPTHLHFTVHQSLKGDLKPINPYRELVQSIQK